mmetsp:Transcript_22175/g.61415  ORF Transcript_22175/g.61415 Transcript_22175/m.61415 type:complete len:217 (+) Transcript_22175:1836-2486(+)
MATLRCSSTGLELVMTWPWLDRISSLKGGSGARPQTQAMRALTWLFRRTKRRSSSQATAREPARTDLDKMLFLTGHIKASCQPTGCQMAARFGQRATVLAETRSSSSTNAGVSQHSPMATSSHAALASNAIRVPVAELRASRQAQSLQMASIRLKTNATKVKAMIDLARWPVLRASGIQWSLRQTSQAICSGNVLMAHLLPMARVPPLPRALLSSL